jgi:hypothetical protein
MKFFSKYFMIFGLVAGLSLNNPVCESVATAKVDTESNVDEVGLDQDNDRDGFKFMTGALYGQDKNYHNAGVELAALYGAGMFLGGVVVGVSYNFQVREKDESNPNGIGLEAGLMAAIQNDCGSHAFLGVKATAVFNFGREDKNKKTGKEISKFESINVYLTSALQIGSTPVYLKVDGGLRIDMASDDSKVVNKEIKFSPLVKMGMIVGF